MAGDKDIVTGAVYTKNTERALIPAGVDGPLGDSLIVSGLVYRKPRPTGAPIGTFDLASVTTYVGKATERRLVSIELTFKKRYARRSWIAKLDGLSKDKKQPAEVFLTGVETYPLGGGLPDRPIVFGVTAGIGAFVGAEGTASIAYDRESEFFAYRFNLV
jgi:hypothetical protein